MQNLRLIGVHEDGKHLLLADDEGTRFRVPLDEPLRAAARQHRPPYSQPSPEVEAGHRPREVQALIRAGLTADEVAQRCGWTIEKVHKYEVPILAEREYVAGLARLVRLRHRGPGSQAPPTLAGRVAERLATRGVDREDIAWDSWREAGCEWTVAVTFPAGGRRRQATWAFDPTTHTIHAHDDEARWLTEDDPSSAGEPIVRDVPVYDIEADGGVEADSAPGGRASRPGEPAEHDLVAAMRQRASARSRRGSRRRPAEPAVPAASAALPLEPALSLEPAAEGTDGSQVAAAMSDDLRADVPPSAGSDVPAEPVETDEPDGTAADPPAALSSSVSATTDPAEPATTSRKPGRPSVPRWEDVVLGTRTSSE